MEDKRLFLLDAYALIFRAYYALIKMPRITSAGFNTSAIFGFVNTLEEILTKENPSHIAVCFDPAGPTFRSEAYDKYKAEREAMPEDIKKSIPIIKEIIKAYNIPILEVAGFEADDVIGTMAKKAEKEGFTTYMMTPDKDFGQLVGPNILQYKPSYRGQDFELRGEKEICERYKIQNTHQIIDLLALMGDKIDNIPGCPRVGEVTAQKFLAEFGSVENLLANTDKIKGFQQKNIREHEEDIRNSYFLATIRTDVPVEAKPDDLKCRKADTDKLFAIFRSLEFRSLLQRVQKRLQAPATTGPQQLSLFDDAEETRYAENAPEIKEYTSYDATKADYRLVDTPQALEPLMAELTDRKECGFFLATSGENDFTASYGGAAIATGEGKACFIPAGFQEGTAAVLDLMARGDIMKVTPDAKRDFVVATLLRKDDAVALDNYYDIGIAHYLLQPDMRHALYNIAEAFLHYTAILDSDVLGKGAKQKNANAVNPAELLPWACESADLALRLKPLMEKELKKSELDGIYHDIELPLVPVLAEMEITGVALDEAALKSAAEEIAGKLAELENEIYSLAGEKFNIGSPAKVGEILFDKLQLAQKAKKTKSGQYSTSEDILEKIADKHPVVRKILEYRQLKKLLTTYLTALPQTINPATGKVHTNYNQTITSTGRISSSNPNLQNIPVRDELGREIRKAFIPSKGNLFLSADYSQIELRLVADFANEETMLKAFEEDKDIHAITASKIYHLPLEEVTPNQRRHAKTANFGILYGITPFGLASRLQIPKSEAKELIDNYYATFPKLHKYISDSVEQARENGYTLTKEGRRRLLPDINSKNPVVRGYAERNAVNAPIQGTAADIIKKAMISIFREMKKEEMKSKMVMQVHDELNFDVVPEELPRLQELVVRNMEAAYSGNVKLTASCGVADNWLDAH